MITGSWCYLDAHDISLVLSCFCSLMCQFYNFFLYLQHLPSLVLVYDLVSKSLRKKNDSHKLPPPYLPTSLQLFPYVIFKLLSEIERNLSCSYGKAVLHLLFVTPMIQPSPVSSSSLSVIISINKYAAMCSSIMTPQRCRCPSLRNLWICYVMWQKGIKVDNELILK